MADEVAGNGVPEPSDGEGVRALARVLERTRQDVEAKRSARAAANARLTERKKSTKPFKPSLSFAIAFAKYFGEEITRALVAVDETFEGTKSGENPSKAVRGPKRVDLNYSTAEGGLGLAISFKSVHQGEKANGDADFIHNMKRNDEELRVEATDHHLRQPYAVFVAVLFLPFEACTDLEPTSSFGSWVEYLWPLKGREEPEDPPDLFELVFVSLYSRAGSELGFYEVGGTTECPRHGRPSRLLTLREFLLRVKAVYDRRNGRDFFFEGERPR